ncbi:hypothetical protein [Microvirga sp. VF16]|nr:hypothetical protein [Microvirga sp. VF16]QRM36184.1 hypothetical protein JO965_46440 [Microvirga sp. VF16]
MTTTGRRLSNEAVPNLADIDPEPCPPVAEYLAGIVMVMNICATVLSLLA